MRQVMAIKMHVGFVDRMVGEIQRMLGQLTSGQRRKSDLLPCVSWRDIVPADTVIETLARESAVNGNVSDFEIDVINRLVKHFEPKTLFEIGTFDGRTSLNMAAHAPTDARVFTLDLPSNKIDDAALTIEQTDRQFIAKQMSGSRFIGTVFEKNITQLYGDSATFDFSPYLSSVDLLFVDGSHSYDYVLKDSATATKIVRPGGVVIWHDYVGNGFTAWPGVTKALNQLRTSDRRFRNMVNIMGTSFAFLIVGGRRIRPVKTTRPNMALDSKQPEYLTAELAVTIDRHVFGADEPIEVGITARNTGLATWLPSDSADGPVRLGVHLLDRLGNWIDNDFARVDLPLRMIRPGDEVRFSATLPSPPKGSFDLDFDLVADGVTWFARNGSQTVRVAVDIE
jgi:predicted O-methyltransferase YrrM